MSSFTAVTRTGPGSAAYEAVARRNAQGLAIQSMQNSVGKANLAARQGKLNAAGMVGLTRKPNLRPTFDDPANVLPRSEVAVAKSKTTSAVNGGSRKKKTRKAK